MKALHTGRRTHAAPRLAAVAVWLLGGGTGLCTGAGSPGLEFVHVPAYGSNEDLAGHVTNVNDSAYGVAVYIFIGGWWTKPTFANPLSAIRADGTWTCDVTTGGSDPYASQIAAFLVPTTYAPPLASGWAQLPAELNSNAVAQVRVTRPYTRRLSFSGYDWSVKDSRGLQTGPGNNCFSDSVSNVWVDARARLHLRICTLTRSSASDTAASAPGCPRGWRGARCGRRTAPRRGAGSWARPWRPPRARRAGT